MKIIVDAFGGDNAPLEIIKGCALAVKELGCDVLLVGDDKKINRCAGENGISLDKMEIKQATDIFPMDGHPLEIVRGMSDSSMAVGLKALADGEGDAFVSAGNTGALVVGATHFVKRIDGVKRPAIGSVMPSIESGKPPYMLVDMGANADCHPNFLNQFAIMGNAYMKCVMGVVTPRVALANIGTEDTKGDKLRQDAFAMMKNQSIYNFIGNIEARTVPFGCADVIVADGFTGNIMLKMYEGTASAMKGQLNNIFKKNLFTKLAYLVVSGGFKQMKRDTDYREFGGAPLLGIKKGVIKAHGSSDAVSIKNAIRQAIHFVENDVVGDIKESIKLSSESDYAD